MSARTNVNATYKGGLRTGNRSIEVAPVKVIIAPQATAEVHRQAVSKPPSQRHQLLPIHHTLLANTCRLTANADGTWSMHYYVSNNPKGYRRLTAVSHKLALDLARERGFTHYFDGAKSTVRTRIKGAKS